MPRRKVAPENRIRGVRACRLCKASKKRCDSGLPCSSCLRRNLADACVYDPPAQQLAQWSSRAVAGSGPQPQVQAQSRTQTQNQNQNQNRTQTTISQATTLGRRPSSSSGVSSHAETVHGETDGPSSEASPRVRMMCDAKGEKFYFGDSAGVSFLQFLRQVLLPHVGPCQFTEDKRHDKILEVIIPDDAQPLPVLSAHRQQRLIDNFFVGTAGILNVFTREQIHYVVQHRDALDGPRTSIGYLVLAIGAQCIVSNTDDSLSPAERSRCFKHGQQLAFQGMLEDLNLDGVYAFLLLSFYLLSACRRNAAFLYIGIAARSAHALGLHAAPENAPCHLTPAEQSQRIRTWESLRVFDLAVSSVLCRPAASLAFVDVSFGRSNSHASGAFRHPTDLSTRHLAVYANVHLCAILEDIVRHLDVKGSPAHRSSLARLSSAEPFLLRLQRWSASLPPALRSFVVPTGQAPFTLRPAEHEIAIGNFSISCLYYFAVILVTRPALISHLLAQLNSVGSNPEDVRNAVETAEAAKLARVCVDAAVLMAHLCRDALQANIILDNMCMLKAWDFTASLILGFARFADVGSPNPRPGLDEAFAAGVDTMKRLADPSGCPQAAHYAVVLSHLSEAVDLFRHKMTRDGRLDGRSSLYVNQILVIDGLNNNNRPSLSQSISGPVDQTFAENPQTSVQTQANAVFDDAGNHSWFWDTSLGNGNTEIGAMSVDDVTGADWGRLAEAPLGEVFSMEPFGMIFDEI